MYSDCRDLAVLRSFYHMARVRSDICNIDGHKLVYACRLPLAEVKNLQRNLKKYADSIGEAGKLKRCPDDLM